MEPRAQRSAPIGSHPLHAQQGRHVARGRQARYVAAGLVAMLLALGGVAARANTSDTLALARSYEHGEGVARDPLRAATLYCDAARDGNAEAAFALGWMYANARGLPRDDARAAALFARAADAGHEYAKRMLERLSDIQPLPPDCLYPPTAWGPPEPEIPVEFGADPFADLPAWKQKVADLVFKTAPEYGVDPRLALAVIAVESNFDPSARSHKNAQGLMQLIPETAARYNVKDPFNPKQNLHGGLAYLRFLLAYYRGQVTLAAAAYNAGEKAVDRYRGIPPYDETQAYVRRVLRLYRNERHPYDARATAPSPVVAPATASRNPAAPTKAAARQVYD